MRKARCSVGKSAAGSWCVGAASASVIRRGRRHRTQRSCEPCMLCEVWASGCNAKPQERSAAAGMNVAMRFVCTHCDRHCGVVAGRLFARALRSAGNPQRRAEPESPPRLQPPRPRPRERLGRPAPRRATSIQKCAAWGVWTPSRWGTRAQASQTTSPRAGPPTSH